VSRAEKEFGTIMEEVEVFGAAKAVAEEPRSERSERSGSSGREALGAPDPEVVAVARRRTFTREYKMRIVEEVDRCKQPGEVGMLLRRERLYSSQLVAWRKLRREAARRAPGGKRGRKPVAVNPLAVEVARLNRENARLALRNRKLEGLIDLQKKASELLGIELPARPESDENF
jgi:transposase-like protein